MNQTEIFQNMTQSKLSLSFSNSIPYIMDGAGRYIATVSSLEDGKENDLRRAETNANAGALCNSWNNTYGKGINPESVEKMKEILERLLTVHAFTSQFQFLSTEIKEILTISKL